MSFCKFSIFCVAFFVNAMSDIVAFFDCTDRKEPMCDKHSQSHFHLDSYQQEIRGSIFLTAEFYY